MARGSNRRTIPNIWPGFVDAMSALLIIVIFLLMVFTLAQFFLSDILSGRNDALDRLNQQVAELAEVLALEKKSNKQLREDLAQISLELETSEADQTSLKSDLGAITSERDQLAEILLARTQDRDLLATALNEANQQGKKFEKELKDAQELIAADRNKIAIQLATLKSLENDIRALKLAKNVLENKVNVLAVTLENSQSSLAKSQDKLKTSLNSLTASRDRSKKLLAKLNSMEERTSLAQTEIKKKKIRLEELVTLNDQTKAELNKEREKSAWSKGQLSLLNSQIATLRKQLARISAALEASETKSQEQNVKIVNLGKRLNAALASKVEELARYRSEFFGKLRKALGKTKRIRVEGDRFVFQSEVLFPSGSANLLAPGQKQITQLAATLKDISKRIPKDVDWVLRVDGHTDKNPIQTPRFPSNWELSTARAIAVVKVLTDLGISPKRLAATGFGQFRPLDSAETPAALNRNRRIEFKLTGR